MKIDVLGANEHNLKNVNVTFGDNLTVVTGVSGSGKTSLVFDTLYHEARRRFAHVGERHCAACWCARHSGLIRVGQHGIEVAAARRYGLDSNR